MKSALATLLIAASAASPVDGGGYWMRVLPAGRFEARDGRGPFDAGGRAEMEKVVAATRAYHGGVDVVVDYDHQSFFGVREGVAATARAAGWIARLEVRDDGIWALVKWTETAAAAIRADEYRYLSPVFTSHEDTGRVELIVSVALTNVPAVDLEAIAASVRHPPTKGNQMDKILKALGLAEGSGEDVVLSAIAGHMAATTALAAIATAAGLNAEAKTAEIEAAATTALTANAALTTAAGLKAGATTEAIVTALVARSSDPDPTKYVPIAAVTELQAQVKALTDNVAADKATAAVDAAMAAGKLPPSMRGWGLDLYKKDATAFTAFVDNAPVLTAPQLTPKDKPTGVDKADPVALSAAATVYQKKMREAGQEIDFVSAVRAVQEGKQ